MHHLSPHAERRQRVFQNARTRRVVRHLRLRRIEHGEIRQPIDCASARTPREARTRPRTATAAARTGRGTGTAALRQGASSWSSSSSSLVVVFVFVVVLVVVRSLRRIRCRSSSSSAAARSHRRRARPPARPPPARERGSAGAFAAGGTGRGLDAAQRAAHGAAQRSQRDDPADQMLERELAGPQSHRNEREPQDDAGSGLPEKRAQRPLQPAADGPAAVP